MEEKTGKLGKFRCILSVLLIIAGIVGFYLLSEQALIFKVLSVIAGVVLAVLCVWTTGFGKRSRAFILDAIAEAKKVVWPTRKETIQMTGVVFAFVVVAALFLFLTDKTLEWLLYDVILKWK